MDNQNGGDGLTYGCLLVIIILLSFIAYFCWQIFEILDSGIWRNLLPS